jgi:hypothetical protein
MPVLSHSHMYLSSLTHFLLSPTPHPHILCTQAQPHLQLKPSAGPPTHFSASRCALLDASTVLIATAGAGGGMLYTLRLLGAAGAAAAASASGSVRAMELQRAASTGGALSCACAVVMPSKPSAFSSLAHSGTCSQMGRGNNGVKNCNFSIAIHFGLAL